MTTQSLVFALVALVHERGYAPITVQDLAERAGISRSTFYAHYRDKDDLLFRSFQAMLQQLDETLGRRGATERVAPVRELLHHMAMQKPFLRSLEKAGILERQFAFGMDVMARSIERRLTARRVSGGVPVAVRARALSGALFALVRWRLDDGTAQSADELDAMFHALV